jgi:peroxiredoxin
MTRARALAALLLLTSSACRAGSREAEAPLWEQPGLGGAIRPEMGRPQPGDLAPDFELPQLSGGSVRLSSLRGSWVVLHFTATWCPYCDAEISHLGEMASAYAPHGVKIVVVGLEEEEATWRSYARARVSPNVVALADKSGDVARTFAPPRAQPSFTDRAQVLFDATLIIDPKATIRLFLLPDSAHFDPTFGGVRGELDRWLGLRTSATVASSKAHPEPLLKPEDVVSIRATRPAGISGEVSVRLEIAPGYHVMSDRPVDAFSIPTRVHIEPARGYELGEAKYPPAASFSVGDHVIRTFAGTVDVAVPFSVESNAESANLWVSVRYQACTGSSCLLPVTKRVPVSLR